MPLTIISRNTTVYREAGAGEMTVLWVPGRDIKVVKDLAGLNSADMGPREGSAGAAGAAKAAQIRKQVPLSRVHIGKRYIYGNLPQEISDLRQSVKVWLTEDYAPNNCQAFFFIFSESVVIHGVREQDDEGFQTWRTAQVALADGDPVKAMIDAISDYALANPIDGLTVAVLNKLDLYEKLQAGLSIYSISPVPFSKLKPQSNLKPLYRHADYTVMYLTFGLFGIIGLLISAGYLLLALNELNNLKNEADGIQQQINSIKPNENIGNVSDPQAMLQLITRSINQQPSAIVHAAGEVAAGLGELQTLKVILGENQSGGEVQISGAMAGQVIAGATLKKLNENMLLGQEHTAAELLETRPWIRKLVRTGSNNQTGNLAMIVQMDQPDNGAATPPPAAPQAEALPVETVTTNQDVSASAEVSGAVAIVSGVIPLVTPTADASPTPVQTQGKE